MLLRGCERNHGVAVAVHFVFWHYLITIVTQSYVSYFDGLLIGSGCYAECSIFSLVNLLS